MNLLRVVRFSAQALVVFGLCLAASAAWAQGGPSDGAGFRAYRLQHVSAEAVAGQVRSLLQSDNRAAELVVDAANNRLLVQGPSQAHEAVVQLLQRADQPPPQQAAAEDRVVRGYRVPAEQLAATTARLRERFGSETVNIASDAPSSQILVIAPPSAHQSIAAALNEASAPAAEIQILPQPNRSPQSTTNFGYHLRFVNWREFESSLRRIWGPMVAIPSQGDDNTAAFRVPFTGGEMATVQLDRRQGLLNLNGSEQLQQAWSRLLRVLDAPNEQGVRTNVVHMQGADPRQVERAVNLIQRAGGTAGPTAPVTLGSVPRATGTSAPARQDPRQDPPQDPPQDPRQDPRQDPLEPQGPPELQPFQPPMQEGQEPQFEFQEEDAEGPIGPIQLQYIPEWGVLVIRGNPRDVARVQKLIDDIKQQSDPTEIELLELKHINANSTAELVINLYNSVFTTRYGALSITSLDKPNALLLIASKETLEVVTDLIAKLDQPVEPASQLKVYQLRHTSAINAMQIVRNFVTRWPGEGADTGVVDIQRLRPALGTRARVLADYRTNSLIIHASPRDLEEIEYLLQKIDVEGVTAEQELRVFRLRNALANDLAPVLQQAITGQSDVTLPAPGGVQQERPSVSLSIIGVDALGNRVINSGMLNDVTVSADPNVNALLVRAPARSMELIAELVRQMDLGPDTEAQIKVFQIENGTAQDLAAMLQMLFGQQVTVGTGTLGQALTALQQQGGTAGDSSLVPLRFAVDIRTNSIIASGSRADLDVVETLLVRLDEGDIRNRRTIIYRLQNSPALDVATSLNQFVTSQRQVIQQTLVAGGSVNTVENFEREMIIIPELYTNSLIVSTSPQYFEDLLKWIQELDRRPLSVQVQVVIAEVKLDDFFELGFEFGLQNSLLFDRSTVVLDNLVPGFNFNSLGPLGNSASAASVATRNTVAGQGLTNFGMGRNNSERGFGGLVLSAASDDVNILIRALQDAGRLQILSRPHVTTLNNQPAFVQVGAQVPRITNSNITQFGISNSTEDVSVGLLLRIQPRVNDDGTVVINIDAERSEVGPIADGIPVAIDQNGQAINSPLILRTTAQSTILTRDGQTVVFAGLIQKTRGVNSRRVPYLSDIPLLGRLFRYDQEFETRTELLVMLTPKVKFDASDNEWINFTESDRMSWCLADLIEMHGDVGLSGGHGLWGPARTRTIYPDEEPAWVGDSQFGPSTLDPTAPVQVAPPTPTQGMLQPTNIDPGPPYQSTFYPAPPNPGTNSGQVPGAGHASEAHATPVSFQDQAGFYLPLGNQQPPVEAHSQQAHRLPQPGHATPPGVTPAPGPVTVYPAPPPPPYASAPVSQR